MATFKPSKGWEGGTEGQRSALFLSQNITELRDILIQDPRSHDPRSRNQDSEINPMLDSNVRLPAVTTVMWNSSGLVPDSSREHGTGLKRILMLITIWKAHTCALFFFLMVAFSLYLLHELTDSHVFDELQNERKKNSAHL